MMKIDLFKLRELSPTLYAGCVRLSRILDDFRALYHDFRAAHNNLTKMRHKCSNILISPQEMGICTRSKFSQHRVDCPYISYSNKNALKRVDKILFDDLPKMRPQNRQVLRPL